MAGAYPGEFNLPCMAGSPLVMLRWMGGSVGAPGWCLPGSDWQFSAPYLRRFGGRYDPDMRARPWEWFTGPFVHQHFVHLFSNVAILLLVGCEVERRYGLPRTVLLFVLTAVGGGALSALAEAHCAVVVGLSGAVFGFLPLYVLDLMKHWRDMTAPGLQVFFFFVFLVTFGASIIRQPTGISHLSHVGGLLVGVFPSLLYQYHILPHHDDTESVHHLRVHPTTLERLECALPIVSGVLLAAYFVVLFTVFYHAVLPGITCPALV